MSNTKKSLLASGLSLLVCFALLLGTTFAWFTDSVTNSGNQITAGTLGITATAYDLDKSNTSGQSYQFDGINNGQPFYFEQDGQNLDDGAAPIINNTNWEPGQSNAKLVTVTNSGDLATKIKLEFDVTDGGLMNALWFDFIQVDQNGVTGQFVRRPMTELTTLADQTEVSVSADQSVSFILVYGMNETAGNEYQNKTFSANVTILATQDTVEQDGFGNSDYDENAVYKQVNVELPESGSAVDNGAALLDAIDKVDAGGTVFVPAGEYEMSAEINITKDIQIIGVAGQTVIETAPNGPGRHLEVEPGCTSLVIKNVSFVNSMADDSKPSVCIKQVGDGYSFDISGCSFEGYTTAIQLFHTTGGSITNCTFSNKTVDISLSDLSGQVTISGNTYTDGLNENIGVLKADQQYLNIVDTGMSVVWYD